MKVLVLVGSTRQGSFNGRLADAAVAALPADVERTSFDITTLPFYNADRDAAEGLGQVVEDFRAAVSEADAVLIASPAYNGGMSAEVKNAIDPASRPRGAAAIAGTPVAVLTSPYTEQAGVGVVEQLRLALRIAGATQLPAVNAPFIQAFDAEGRINATFSAELDDLATALVHAVEQGGALAA